MTHDTWPVGSGWSWAFNCWRMHRLRAGGTSYSEQLNEIDAAEDPRQPGYRSATHAPVVNVPSVCSVTHCTPAGRPAR